MNHMMLVCNFIFYLKHFSDAANFSLYVFLFHLLYDTKDSCMHSLSLVCYKNCITNYYMCNWHSVGSGGCQCFYGEYNRTIHAFRWFTWYSKFKYLCNKTLRYLFGIGYGVACMYGKIMYSFFFWLKNRFQTDDKFFRVCTKTKFFTKNPMHIKCTIKFIFIQWQYPHPHGTLVIFIVPLFA